MTSSDDAMDRFEQMLTRQQRWLAYVAATAIVFFLCERAGEPLGKALFYLTH